MHSLNAVYIHNKLFSILTPLIPLHVTCKDHFVLSNDAFDDVSCLIPVNIENSVHVCFVENILSKCLFLDLSTSKYIVVFPSTMLFD